MHTHANESFTSTGAWKNYNALHDHLREEHGPWPVGLPLSGLDWQTLMSLHRLCPHTPNLVAGYEQITGFRGRLLNRDTGKTMWSCDHRHIAWAEARKCAEGRLATMPPEPVPGEDRSPWEKVLSMLNFRRMQARGDYGEESISVGLLDGLIRTVEEMREGR